MRKLISKHNSDTLHINNSQNDLFQIISSIDSIKRNSDNIAVNYSNDIPIDNLQDFLTESNTVLDYYYNDSLLFILAITKETFDLEVVRLDLKLEELISSYIQCIKFLSPDAFAKKSNQLYKLLIDPIKDIIDNSSSLTIIPHQYLFVLPFETLISGTANNSFSDYHYLINDYDIKYNYSSSILFNQLLLNNSQDYKYSFTGFAPFTQDNQSYNVEELLYSKDEVNEIAKLFNDNDNPSNVYLDTLASEEEYKQISKIIENNPSCHSWFI